MAVCSHPDCTKPALGQWQRAATDAESAAFAQGHHDNALDAAAFRRTRHQIAIAEMRQLQAQATELDTKDGDRTARMLDAQAADEQAAHDAIKDPVQRPPTSGTVAVFGCEDHLIDADKATHLHESRCLMSADCACETTPPEPSEALVAADAHPALAAKGWA